MKKKLIVIMMCIVLFITGCSSTEVSEVASINSNNDISIWTDTETGVQYIIYSRKHGYAGMGGITPRLNSDGSLYKVE